MGWVCGGSHIGAHTILTQSTHNCSVFTGTQQPGASGSRVEEIQKGRVEASLRRCGCVRV